MYAICTVNNQNEFEFVSTNSIPFEMLIFAPKLEQTIAGINLLMPYVGGAFVIGFLNQILFYGTEYLDEKTMHAIMWHEIGHIQLGHVLAKQSNRTEIEADTYAAKHMTKEELISLINWLKKARKSWGSIFLIVPFFQFTARIRNLEKILKTK